MSTIDHYLRQIENCGHPFECAGPQSEEAIRLLEEKFGVKLPHSYRDFLSRFGAASIYDSTVSGIWENNALGRGTGWLYGDTVRFRNEYDLPDHLLVIQPDSEAPYCFDTLSPDKRGEFPIVCFELHSRNAKKIADGFERWFLQWFLKPWSEGN
jgi:hypothetical protein